MRTLITLIAIAALAHATRASADAPPLIAPPRVAPAAEPAGGLRLGAAAPLRCEACDDLRVAGWGLFAAGYAMQLVGFGGAEYLLWTDKGSDESVLNVLKPVFAVLLLPATIPVVGPLLLAIAANDGHWQQALFQTRLGWAALVSSSAQVVGLAGAALGEHLRIEFQRTHRLTVVPLLQPGASGLAVGGTF